MSYKSPITYYSKGMNDIYQKMADERDGAIYCQIIQQYGVDVDRRELEKALNYDREQYKKGFNDAKEIYEKALDKACDMLATYDLANRYRMERAPYSVEEWKEWALNERE